MFRFHTGGHAQISKSGGVEFKVVVKHCTDDKEGDQSADGSKEQPKDFAFQKDEVFVMVREGQLALDHVIAE